MFSVLADRLIIYCDLINLPDVLYDAGKDRVVSIEELQHNGRVGYKVVLSKN